MVRPPCEIWSVARGEGNGPRKVRPAQHLWAIPGLANRTRWTLPTSSSAQRSSFSLLACRPARRPS
eukprot:1342240-Lingulodinium_polyedra.AAC.1